MQLCGDAHLSNFGVFASPERHLLFDLNDFDETLPGPFEYDVKRMAASFTIAARNNGFSKAEASGSTLRVRHGVPRRHGRVRADGTMEIWYAPSDRGRRHARPRGAQRTRSESRRPRRAASRRPAARSPRLRRRTPATACRRSPSSPRSSTAGTASSASHRSSSRRASCTPLRPLRRGAARRPSTSSSAPTVPPCSTTAATCSSASRSSTWHARWSASAASGTRAFIVLLQGRDEDDPLFLQVKEATASVLEDHLPKSRYKQPGERVVQGQRMMQAASDIYLGWTEGRARRPVLLLAAAARHEGVRRGRADVAARASRSTRDCAAGRSHALTRAPGTPSRSPPTWAGATRSTGPSPTSRHATPTRTSTTTKPSSRPCAQDGWRRSRACDAHFRDCERRPDVRQACVPVPGRLRQGGGRP